MFTAYCRKHKRNSIQFTTGIFIDSHGTMFTTRVLWDKYNSGCKNYCWHVRNESENMLLVIL